MNQNHAIRVEITDQPISTQEWMARLGDPAHGAQLVFLGVVREKNQGKKVVAVSYDIFAPLAVRTLTRIAEEAQSQWDSSLQVHVVHRTGKLNVGEASVWIGVSGVHRSETYEASRYVLEELKHRAPIWKKEHYEDGETEWLQGHALCGHA